jgi:hypothetical protein
MKRVWLWLGIIVNALVFVPAAYMAASAINIARASDFNAPSASIAGLFLALPVFCIAVPFAARRSVKRGRSSAHTAILLLSPLVYAVFLVFLLVG